ncbi:DNA cytosine methyltransferase [Modestobacter roseus]|uniref:Cytosine-specific methyltransferase n=1 Tax=Modestobacter roseus TaxID=1181884 RepID=A0A562IRI2_9ACTN|nr:DNA cytosine methyltransferase [Modestobacter roseus]TWH73621.1 DNA (cytosine-5)-methyltransferase 1 [Modestobacter roseus]
MGHYGVTLQRSDALRLPPHPEGPSVRTLRAWAHGQVAAGRPIAVDLFSGAGGLSAGVEAAGWAVAAAVDHDARALETHRHNFPGLALDLDLGESAARDSFVNLFADIPVDLVAGGPPCQPFSRAGRSKIRSLVEAGTRDAVDTRRELWAAFLDIALRLKPRAILMENVPDMGLGDDFRVVRTMVDALEAAGYATKVQLAEAWRFGVPQHRKRLILLARRDGCAFSWPDEAPVVTTLRDSISDLPALNGTTGAREMPYVAPPTFSAFAARMREGAVPEVLHDHMTRPVRPDDLEVFQMMTSKTLYSDIPEHLRRYKADSFDDKYKRLDWNDVSRSITAHIAKDGYWYIHPEEHRTLTVREAARIQTFPDEFRFAGTRSDAFRQIGNAVPPLLGEAAARALGGYDRPAAGDSINWLQVRRQLADWAAKQRTGDYWHTLPGSAVTPPVAIGAAVLCSTRTDLKVQGDALRHFRGLAELSALALKGAIEALPAGKAGRSLERLRPLVRRKSAWVAPESVPQLIALTPAERQVFALLRGEDLLLRSQGVLRVAARVAGSTSHETNRLSDGRIDLARLVGGGEDAALRMAGLRLLAATRCKKELSDCSDCPLVAACQTAQGGVAAKA